MNDTTTSRGTQPNFTESFESNKPHCRFQEQSKWIKSFNQKIARARAVLGEERNKRALPFRDEKVLAAWNGLMVSADEKNTVFICDEQGCRPPVFSGKEVKREIEKATKFKRYR